METKRIEKEKEEEKKRKEGKRKRLYPDKHRTELTIVVLDYVLTPASRVSFHLPRK